MSALAVFYLLSELMYANLIKILIKFHNFHLTARIVMTSSLISREKRGEEFLPAPSANVISIRWGVAYEGQESSTFHKPREVFLEMAS